MPIHIAKACSIDPWAVEMLQVAMRGNDIDFYPFDMGSSDGQIITEKQFKTIAANFTRAGYDVANSGDGVCVIASKFVDSVGIAIEWDPHDDVPCDYTMRFYVE